MKKERFNVIPAVFLALFNGDGQILMMRRYQTGHQDGNYGLPSGHLEGGESMRQALVREVREEVGIDVDMNDLTHAVTTHRNCIDHERVDILFTAHKWAGEVSNKEPDKCDDIGWFSLTNLPGNTIDYVRMVLEAHGQGKTYSEYDW